MTTRTHHVFFSYARPDNGEENNHFVTQSHDLLCKEHEGVPARQLKTFFDTKAIEEGEHWKARSEDNVRQPERLNNKPASPEQGRTGGTLVKAAHLSHGDACNG